MRHQKQIGRYHLLKHLGTGAYGDVYLCTCHSSPELYACKIISLEHLNNPLFFQHFQNELVIHSSVSHPAITQIKDALIDMNNVYIIMEYCEGGDLADIVIENKGIREDIAKHLFRQLISALNYIHQRGIAHRDIKLENILISHGNAKLTDFGLSKRQLPNSKLSTSCGTLVYSAPEIVLEVPYDGPPIDIWSAGVVLYAMVANHFPWVNEEDLNIDELTERTIQQICNADFPMPPEISPELQSLLYSMLEVNPHNRQTAESILSHPWFDDIETPYDDFPDPDPDVISIVNTLIDNIKSRLGIFYEQ